MSSLRIDVSQGFKPPTPPFTQAKVMLYGHSYVAGAIASRVGTTDFASRLSRMLTRIDPTIWSMSFLGHGGFRTGHAGDGTGNQLWSLAAAEVDTQIVGGKCNIHLYCEGGLNSVGWYQLPVSGGGPGLTPAQTTAQTISDMTAYYQARRAAGWTKANGNLLGACLLSVIPLWRQPDLGYAQSFLDINTWHRNVAIPTGLVDFLVDTANDAELNKVPFPDAPRIIGDNTHFVDYGHMLYFDLLRDATITAYETMPNAKQHIWTPAFLNKLQWWVDMSLGGNYVVWDGFGKVFKLIDQSSWAYDLTATSTLRPTWNRVNRSIDGASGNCMTTTLAVAGDYTQKINVLLSYSCTSTGTVIAELGNNAPAGTSGWVITHEVGGPKIASYGNVGQSNATATAISGGANHSVIFTIDHGVTTNQGSINLDGNVAPGSAHVDAPNTNFFGNLTLNLFGRNGGTSSSTLKLRAACATSGTLSAADITNWVAYQASI